MLAAVGLIFATPGSGGRALAAPLVNAGGKQLFLHHMIDANPPGGFECCTDVIALGDIDGDGWLDVVVGAENAGRSGLVWDDPSTWKPQTVKRWVKSAVGAGDTSRAGLVWYQYPTWQRHDIAEGEFTTDGVVADFDGDGDADIVVGDIATGLTWFEQTSAGGREWRRHLLAPGYVHDLRVADVTGDDRADVVVVDKRRVAIVERGADGAAPTLHVILDRKGEGLAIVDLDGDGDLDILYSNVWLERTADAAGGWTVRDIAPSWPVDTRIQAVDMNGDGRLDVVLSASEGEGRLAWFEAPAPGSGDAWIERRISDEVLVGAHSLRVADFDLDGDQDVMVAEMHTSPGKRILVFRNDSDGWRRLDLATHGSHNMAAGDVDGDGDIDLVGKNYGGPGRFVEYWENRSADLRLTPAALSARDRSAWRYEPIDSARPAEDRQKFGLLSADMNGDGHADVVAGGTLYVNPGAAGSNSWSRVTIGPAADTIHITDFGINGWRSVVAVTDRAVLHVTPDDAAGTAWSGVEVGELPEGRTQGWAAGARRPDGTRDLFFTRATTLFRLGMPAGPDGSWSLERVREGVQEEAVALGDLDGDGDDDLAFIDGSGRQIIWLETVAGQPGVAHRLGASLRWFDRLELADINGDGRTDIVFAEETGNADYNGRVGWLEAPGNPRDGQWRSHTIVVLRSANSLGVADMDGDGAPDVIVAEHTDFRDESIVTENFTGVFLNRGNGRWMLDVVEIGPHSSHLGAKPADLDGDGVNEILSVGWAQSCCVHRWVRTVSHR